MQKIQLEVVQLLRELGWQIFTDNSVKVTGLELNGDAIYVKNELKTKLEVVFHPCTYSRLVQLSELNGASVPRSDNYDHMSNYRRFPKRKHTGKEPTCYGYAVQFDSMAHVKPFMKEYIAITLNDYSSAQALFEDLAAIDADVVGETEKQELRSARIGQGKFRRDLLSVFNQRCAATGVQLPAILEAAHIKPWKKSSNEERLDVNNGLLLVANLHKMLDSNFLTFDDQGWAQWAPKIDDSTLAVLGLRPGIRIDIGTSARREYLRCHREKVFATWR